jgi:CarD family transcriptional regulator
MKPEACTRCVELRHSRVIFVQGRDGGGRWPTAGVLVMLADGDKRKKNNMSKAKKPEFRPNDFVVYPAHGVGKIISIEEQEIAGLKLELFVISFEKDKMTLRVPTNKATEVGMRGLSSPDIVSKAMDTLKGKARVKRAMWSRRAQEYEQKINSGDLISIAEVVRDLHRNDDQREQSYSERQLYEAALERFTREVAAVSDGDESAAQRKVDDVLTARAAA